MASCKACSESKRCSSRDRKSTRLNSSHVRISYAVFCLKKKKELHLAAVVEEDSVVKEILQLVGELTRSACRPPRALTVRPGPDRPGYTCVLARCGFPAA